MHLPFSICSSPHESQSASTGTTSRSAISHGHSSENGRAMISPSTSWPRQKMLRAPMKSMFLVCHRRFGWFLHRRRMCCPTGWLGSMGPTEHLQWVDAIVALQLPRQLVGTIHEGPGKIFLAGGHELVRLGLRIEEAVEQRHLRRV